MTEPLFKEEKMDIKLYTVSANGNEKIDFNKFDDYFIDVKRDYFGWLSAGSQMKRLITSDLPKCIGIQCI